MRCPKGFREKALGCLSIASDAQMEFQSVSLRIYRKPRHGWFTNPGSDTDRYPLHHDTEKFFLFSEQIIVVVGFFMTVRQAVKLL